MVFIHVAFHEEEEAKNVSKLVLEQGLAATIDLSRMSSLHIGPEGLVSQPGVAILIKTVESKVQEIESLIHEHNSHKTPPCIAVINLFRINRDYKEWLSQTIH